MKSQIHAAAGLIGFLAIVTFWSSTAISELFGSKEMVVAVKTMILNGMWILIPAMVMVGASGMAMGKRRRDAPAVAKKRRMPVIALNGLLILLPAAFYLQSKAVAARLDVQFYLVQSLELVAGAVNLTLMGLNIRDGLTMTGRLGRRQG